MEEIIDVKRKLNPFDYDLSIIVPNFHDTTIEEVDIKDGSLFVKVEDNLTLHGYGVLDSEQNIMDNYINIMLRFDGVENLSVKCGNIEAGFNIFVDETNQGFLSIYKLDLSKNNIVMVTYNSASNIELDVEFDFKSCSFVYLEDETREL